MLNTHVRPVRDLRNNYPELAEIVKEHDHIIITNNGRSEAVLIGFDDFKLYEEFLHFRYVDQMLAEAESREDIPETRWFSHKEFFQKLRDDL